MAKPILSDFLRRLARGMAAETLNEHSDRELVQKALDERDEASLQAIVNRHGPMVYRVCWRVLQHSQDAEDAFQATFLILAQKLRTVRKQASLASWLHGVAHRVALKARAQSAARRRREQHLQSPTRLPPDEVTWGELRSALDQELARLPEKWRQPLILCYLEGRTQDESASLLGWSKSTLRRRLEEARTALGGRLHERGIVLPAALSAVLLSECASSAALSPSLLGSLVTSTAGVVAGKSLAAISPRVVALMKGVRTTMILANLKTTTAILVFIGLAAAGIGGAGLARHEGPINSALPPSTNEVPQTLVVSKPQESGNKQPAKGDEPAAQSMRVVVLDPDGKPLPNAKVLAGIWTKEQGFKHSHDYQTDASGTAQVELPKTYYIVRLWASKKPLVTMFSHWEQNELAGGMKLPAAYTMQLERGGVAGGQVVDEHGNPIAGAKVQVMTRGTLKPAGSDSRTEYDCWLAQGSDALTTDARGRWHIDNVPLHQQTELSLLITHPDFVSDEQWGETQKRSGITSAMLRGETATAMLKRGAIVRGRVTDPAGKPIKDAIVIVGKRPYDSIVPVKFPTDADGRFRLPALAPREETLTVMAPGLAPQMRNVDLQPGGPPQDFRMLPGKPIRLQFVDAAGKPVPRVSVFLKSWKGSESIETNHNSNQPKIPSTGIPKEADANGIWVWNAAPEEPVKIHAFLKGFDNCDMEIAGGEAPRTVVLKSAHRIEGQVTDAVTGKPIPSFAVIQLDVFRKDSIGSERMNAVSGSKGRLDFLAKRTDIPLRLRIEAPGYRTQDGPEFRVGDDSPRTQNFRLQPSPAVVGSVVDEQGRPVAGAAVSMATPTEIMELMDDGENHTVSTDSAGLFSYPDPGEPMTLMAQANAGFAIAELPAGQHEVGTMKLRPWASIRGRFHDGGRPVSGATILVDLVRIHSLDRPSIQTTRMQVVTDAEGRFELPRVPPGPVVIRVYLGPWTDETFRSGPSVPLDLQSGQKVELDLGRGGAQVSGKVKLTGKIPTNLDCNYSLNYLISRTPGITPPAELANLGFDASRGWSNSWERTTEGRAYMSTLPHWFVKLAPDGSYRVSGVPAGHYDLSIKVYAKPSGCLVDPLAETVVPVTVTAQDVEPGAMSLPDISAPVVPVLAVGDVPQLTFQRADSSAGSLADCRGKYALVHFWASWCGPCKQQLPAVRKLHDQFGPRGLAMLGLSVEDDNSLWLAALKRLDLAWPQARLAKASGGGISSVPAYWLLDPTGKIVAKVNDVDELSKVLADNLK